MSWSGLGRDEGAGLLAGGGWGIPRKRKARNIPAIFELMPRWYPGAWQQSGRGAWPPLASNARAHSTQDNP